MTRRAVPPLVVIMGACALAARIWGDGASPTPAAALAETPVAEETPFLRDGRPLRPALPDGSTALLEPYHRAVARYPSAASCGYDPASPDLARRWGEALTNPELEICLFRVLSKLGTQDAGDAWLTANGWSTSGSADRSGLAGIYGASGPLTQFAYVWSVEENGFPYRPAGWFQRATTRALWLCVLRDAARGIVSVETVVQGAWSK